MDINMILLKQQLRDEEKSKNEENNKETSQDGKMEIAIVGLSNLSSNESPDEKICRICLEHTEEPFISPCKCKGTQKYIHRSCLNRWRFKKPENFFECHECKTEYKFNFSNSLTRIDAKFYAISKVILPLFLFLSIYMILILLIAGIFAFADTDHKLLNVFNLNIRSTYLILSLIIIIGIQNVLFPLFLFIITIIDEEPLSEGYNTKFFYFVAVLLALLLSFVAPIIYVCRIYIRKYELYKVEYYGMYYREEVEVLDLTE
jgi:hypothetical protein